MIAFLLPQWKVFLGIGIASAVLITLHNLDIGRIEAKQATELQAQKDADKKICDNNKKITSNSENYYEALYTASNAKLNSMLQHPPKCVPITKSAHSGNATNVINKQDSSNGISSDALYNFAGECETDRIKVMTLQNFIQQVWKINGQ